MDSVDSVEVEGKTYEEAIKKACAELNAEEKDLDIEVKEVDTKGILGLLGSKKVRIQAKVRITPEEYGRRFVVDVAKFFGVSTSITFAMANDRLVYSIDASDEDALVGKDGEVLEALQYLVRLAIAKKYKENLKLLLDLNNFREKRKKTIIVMAKRLADKVRRIGKPVKTKPLNPYERRIIHTMFKNNNFVSTASEGEGHTKKVIISPSGAPGSRGGRARPGGVRRYIPGPGNGRR